MRDCQTCPTSLVYHCNDCSVRIAKEMVKVLGEEGASTFVYYMNRFDKAWKEMAK